MKPQWIFIDDAETKTVHYVRLDMVARIEDVLTQPRRTAVTMTDGVALNFEGNSADRFMAVFRKWAEGLL